MSRQELIRIVSKDDKGIGEVKGPLSILYRRILLDLGLGYDTILNGLESWLYNANGPVEQSSKKRTQARGNYIKKMIEPTMTWKSFADLVMMLYPEYIKFTVTLGWPGGDPNKPARETTHHITMSTAYLLEYGAMSRPVNFPVDIVDYRTDLESEDEDEEDIYGNHLYGQDTFPTEVD